MSFDSVEENRAFSEKCEFNFPLLCDTERALGIAYGACGADGRGSAKRIGVVIDADGNIASFEPSAHAKQYPAQVLATL